jgi:hypothetical protein
MNRIVHALVFRSSNGWKSPVEIAFLAVADRGDTFLQALVARNRASNIFWRSSFGTIFSKSKRFDEKARPKI